MYISDVALDDYRSYEHVVAHFAPGINVLVGANGQGKTNFVEAIHYLAAFGSHRVSADNALVRFDTTGVRASGKPRGAVVRVKLNRQGRERFVDIEIVAGKANRARLNRHQVSPKEVLGQVKSVLFAPEDLSIIRTDPASRRRFMDELLSQAYPRYAAYLSDYSKVMGQRSATLRQMKYEHSALSPSEHPTLSIWNDQLVIQGAHIMAHRARLIESLNPHAARTHAHIAQSDRDLRLEYQPALAGVDVQSLSGQQADPAMVASVDPAVGTAAFGQRTFDNPLADPSVAATALRAAIDTVSEREVERGVNLVGPHRDELGIYLDNMPVKGFASHGETWSAALAMRLAEFHVLRSLDEDDDPPVLILDDVYAELDSSRRQALEDMMADADQVFVTAAVKSDIPPQLDADFFEVTMTRDRDGQPASVIAPWDDKGGTDDAADTAGSDADTVAADDSSDQAPADGSEGGADD